MLPGVRRPSTTEAGSLAARGDGADTHLKPIRSKRADCRPRIDHAREGQLIARYLCMLGVGIGIANVFCFRWRLADVRRTDTWGGGTALDVMSTDGFIA